MKKLVGLIIILVVLILGGYYGTGMMTERTLKKDITLVNQANGLNVTINRYDRGWFTSKADLLWKVHVPERVVKGQDDHPTLVPAQNYTMDMPLSIYHGPVIFAKDGVHFGLGYAKTELNLPDQFKEKFSETFANESTTPKLNVSVLVNYLNRSRFRAQLPQFTLIAKDGGGTFEWHGMTSDVTLTSQLDHIDGDMNIKGINVKKDQMTATVSQVSSEYNLYQAENGLYLGQASFSLPSVLVTNHDQKTFELSKFNAHTKSDIEDGLFHSHLEVSLNQLYMDGKTYGPGEIKLAIKNLDADVLAKINEQANQVQGSSDAERQQALFTILPELPKLFSKGAQLEVTTLSFVMPEGNIEGNLTLNLPQGDSSNPFQLIQQIRGEGHLKMPAEFVKQGFKEAAKRQLIKQPSLQDALANQMQMHAADEQQEQVQQPAGNEAQAAGAQNQDGDTQPQGKVKPQEQAAQSDATTAPAEQPVTKQMTLAELDQKAEAKAQEKLDALVAAGALEKQGNEYVIHVTLSEGQLTVNGNPFNPAMVQF
ncbi:YdgA family protein [Legionella yabuuchiae]|uniref:YdgA family protein n=1 Tax=Legionella yabuuchiae TaxID=376727 RepID=UPI001055EA22|nr:YdgA family protein [Legionella yabuuchiae]